MRLRDRLPAEVRLLTDLLAGRAPTAPEGLDWGRAAAAAADHRLLLAVGPLLLRLPGLPADPAADIRRRLRNGQLRGLALTHESARLAAAFAAAGIDALILKGAAFAALIHAQPERRASRDIDFLVPPAQEAAALEVLQREGYRMQHREANAVLLAGDPPRPVIELHTRLGDPAATFPDRLARPHEAPAAAPLGAMQVATLRPELAIAYAAHHGTRHLWRRLFWVWDMAAAAGNPAVDWQATATLSRRIGVERQVALGLVLAHELLDAPLPSPFAGAAAAVGPLAAILAPVWARGAPHNHKGLILQVGLPSYLRLRLASETRLAAKLAIIGELLDPAPVDPAAPPGRWARLRHIAGRAGRAVRLIRQTRRARP